MEKPQCKEVTNNITPGWDFDSNVKVCLGRLLYRTISDAFRNPEVRKEFEAWYLENYGEPYVWKKIYPQK